MSDANQIYKVSRRHLLCNEPTQKPEKFHQTDVSNQIQVLQVSCLLFFLVFLCKNVLSLAHRDRKMCVNSNYTIELMQMVSFNQKFKENYKKIINPYHLTLICVTLTPIMFSHTICSHSIRLRVSHNT